MNTNHTPKLDDVDADEDNSSDPSSPYSTPPETPKNEMMQKNPTKTIDMNFTSSFK